MGRILFHSYLRFLLKKAILEVEELSECAVVELRDQIKGVIPFGFLVRTKCILKMNKMKFFLFCEFSINFLLINSFQII